uniref:Uncharacterized protein n=1 Tax=Trichogramma kaykai TaxID=54128 RepID=A0ABD2X0F4_9HYME
MGVAKSESGDVALARVRLVSRYFLGKSRTCACDATVHVYADGSAAGCARRVSHTRLEAAIARGLRSTRNRILAPYIHSPRRSV